MDSASSSSSSSDSELEEYLNELSPLRETSTNNGLSSYLLLDDPNTEILLYDDSSPKHAEPVQVQEDQDPVLKKMSTPKQHAQLTLENLDTNQLTVEDRAQGPIVTGPQHAQLTLENLDTNQLTVENRAQGLSLLGQILLQSPLVPQMLVLMSGPKGLFAGLQDGKITSMKSRFSFGPKKESRFS